MEGPLLLQRSRRSRRLLFWAPGIMLFVLFMLAMSFWLGSSQMKQFQEINLKTFPFVDSFELQKQTRWLLATMSPAHGQRRRNIIRATWQKMFADSAFETRFVISNPGQLWQPLIDHENATFGDLIVLSHLREEAHVANTIKSMEFIKRIANEGRSWDFVSKIDDDSFVDAKTMYFEFLRPLIDENQEVSEQLRTIIARKLTISRSDQSFPYPGGQFYTLSWEMTKCLGSLYTEDPIADEYEDVLVGRLLNKGNVSYDFVVLNDSRAFDVKEGLHKVGAMTINPHKMKDDETYLEVASLYNSHGYQGREND